MIIRNLKRIMVGALLTTTIAFTLSGCGKKSDEGPVDVRVAYFPNITHSQALVMKDQQGLEERLGDGYNVEWISFNAGPDEITAIFAGEVDLGYIGPVPAINAYIKSKGDVNIIAGATNAGAVLLTRSGANITSVKELAGKTVAIPQLGNTQHLSLLNILSENNLVTKDAGGDVNVVAVANADIKNLMDQGTIDAALVPEPWGSIIEKETGANILLDYDEVWMEGNYPTAVVIVSKDFLEDHEDIVAEFLAEHKEATLFINDNKEEAKEIINRQIEEVTQNAIADDVLDKALGRLVITDETSFDVIKAFAELNLQEGFIDELPDEKIVRINEE